MKARTARVRWGMAALLVAGGVALCTLASSSSAPARAASKLQKEKEYPKPPAGQKPEWVGAAVCQQCHNEEKPGDRPLYKQTRGFEFVRLWENKVWEAHDLHSQAYKNLITDRSPPVPGVTGKPNPTAQRMEDNLRRYKGDKYTVATDPACLACHASVKKRVEDHPPEKWTVKDFEPIDGVGCEMCHGHGSLYEQPHQRSRPLNKDEPAMPDAVRAVDWREWEPHVKKEWGLINLRDPAVATAQCASCHVGNAKEGRFVTHDMFAAGHPPLPPLDLMAFSREQPRHWGLPTELPYFAWLAKTDAKKAESVFHYRADESFVARRFAESVVATLHASAVSTWQLAETTKDEGLDFAAFDCSSCHHNLKYPSDRQERGYVGKPGRPLFRPAAFALARVVVEHAAEMKDGAALKDSLDRLAAAEKSLAAAFATRTLGDPAKIATASKELSDWSTDTLKKLAAVRYTPDETRKLLDKVLAATQTPVGDPEVAQVYTWAFETLVLELHRLANKNQADKNEVPKAIEELRQKLNGTVVTRLRPNQLYYYEQGITTPPTGKELEPVDARIKTRMEVFNSFQREPFQKAFRDVKPLLPK